MLSLSNEKRNDGSAVHRAMHAYRAQQGRQRGVLRSPLHVLTFATGSYLRWLQLLHANLRLLALPATEFCVCTADETSRRAARAMGVEVLDFSRLVTGQINWPTSPPRQVAERFGTASYVNVVHAKTHCIISKLSQLRGEAESQPADARIDALLFFVDGDVTLFGDPRPHFAAMGVELAFMSDNTISQSHYRSYSGDACGLLAHNASAKSMVFNSGFFLLRVGPAALWLWSTVQAYHRDHPQVMQQAALNAVLNDKRYWAPGEAGSDPRQRALSVEGSRLRVAPLDEATFLNGHCFYQRRPLRADAANVMAVHHNFINGDGRKFERARAYHATVDESDRTWEAFARRARAAMDANASWNPAGDPAGHCGGHDTFKARWSPLRRQCRKGKAPMQKFCRSRVPPALWAANGAGSDWLRVVLELVTGHSTGSVNEDRALAALMPSEMWPWETREECGSMLVLATPGLLAGPPWSQIACGGEVSRAIFLVRHPFGVAWAKWNPDRLGHVQGRRWPAHAEHTARKWVYLVDFSNLRVDYAYRVWMKEKSVHLWVRLEDLLDHEGGRAEYELRKVLDFALDGQYRLGGHVVRCALRKATARLRAANKAEKEECVVEHSGTPDCCAQCAMRRAFEHTFEDSNHGPGQRASQTTNRSVGDTVWNVAEGSAPTFGYTRQSYTALGPHSRPSLGAQSSVAQLVECDCPERRF